MTYRRRRTSDTWHWHTTCSVWPTLDYVERQTKPTNGDLCNQCKSKS